MDENAKITVCTQCRVKKECREHQKLGYVCIECSVKFDQKVIKRLELKDWINSTGSLVLLIIAVGSLSLSTVFDVLNYFK